MQTDGAGREAHGTTLGIRCCGCGRLPPTGPEHRPRTTVITIVAAAQNGTSGVIAGARHFG